MEVGIFNHFPYQYTEGYHDFPRPNSQFDPLRGHDLFIEYLDEFEYADKLGFDLLTFNEHHSKEYNLDSGPNLIAAYLVARTKRAKILPTGAILPIHNPLRIAEEYAMLDVISGGRIVAGFERGGITNYLAYSVPLEDKAKFEEAWELIVKAWTAHEPFEWNGRFYKFSPVSIWPRPFTQPHPPIHTAGPSAAFAAIKDASYGLWVQPTSEIMGVYDVYRDAYTKAHGTVPGRDRVSLIRSVYVSEDSERAKIESEKHILYTYKTLWRPSMLAVKKEEERIGRKLFWASRLFLTEMNYDELVEAGMHIAGSPDSVVDQILKQQKDVGFGAFIGEFRFGSLPHNMAMRNIQLFKEKVMPKLREELPVSDSGQEISVSD